MYNKKVGIYIPTHNRLELLKKAIDSVLNQTYQNFTLLVVNDGSSDGTQAYLEQLNDPRVSFIHNEVSQGACKSRNLAIEHLDTELVTGLDDDDVFLPERLEQLLTVYSEEYSFVCSGYFWDYGVHKKALFNKDRVISLSDAFDLNQCSNQILAKRDYILSVGGFDVSIPALQDHDLWVRLIAQFGSAFRIGSASYIVNDDQYLERISSVTNKLNAIKIFESKHGHLMSKRNKENFEFYRSKINGDRFGVLDFAKSTRYGLVGLKARQYVSQNFSKASRIRLELLQSGSITNNKAINWVNSVFLPLVATGGPGASRVILLTACILFLGASESSSFSSDFFIVMILNTAFAQCFGFFLLKPEHHENFQVIVKQSLYGLALSIASAYLLFSIGLISHLGYSVGFIITLHFYYIYRYYCIAHQRFGVLAFVEIIISLACLILPFIASQNYDSTLNTPYQIYLVASLIGLILIFFLAGVKENRVESKVRIKISSIKNISISFTASVFAIFMMPSMIKTVASAEIVSIVALTISCVSIIMLIPRTYANKIMSQLAQPDVCKSEFQDYSSKYSRLIIISASVGVLLTFGYLSLILPEIGYSLFLAPLCVSLILVFAQQGFISLTFLSLQGAERKVANLNLFVLAVMGLLSISILVGLSTEFLLYFIMIIACVSFGIRNKLAARETSDYLVK